ncbi:hypothetical protein AVEN_194387-1 [Araneus ventricosus]|uniref:Uncharacterized protein n=1 Tax=Araneus ventricosus TaxID=182803 RepID=A0A4Y2A5J5_ARAVE|nr:hypothetical protein AVEN_194387-1 [Araneus ventricosus]
MGSWSCSMRWDQDQMDSWSEFREVNRFEDSDSILRGEFKNLRSLCGSKGINFSSTLPVKFWQMWFCHSQIDQFRTKKTIFTEDKTFFSQAPVKAK